MSYSKLASVVILSPNCTKPRNHAIDTVTVHCTAGQGTAAQILSLPHFVNRDNVGGASCNYAIGYDGSIGVGVEEENRSWCSSSRSNDNRAVTIEVSSDHVRPYRVTDKAYFALIDLLTDICKRNGISELKWKADKSLIGDTDKQNMTVHRWFANKECPGEYLYSRHYNIAELVNERLGVKTETEDIPPIDPPKETDDTFKVGDVVEIKDGAKYYNGKVVPFWVRRKRWIVDKVVDNYVIINRSEDGINAIKSPIRREYLEVYKKGAVKDNEVPFMIKHGETVMYIYESPSFDSKKKKELPKGVFTITEVQNGFGRLKSGWGWISLDYVEKVN